MKKQFLKECFTINNNGQLIWNERPLNHFASKSIQNTFNKQFAHSVAGARVTKGNKVYIYITIGDKRYGAHRLAWIMVNGDLPQELHIDHINGDSTDNRPENLRAVNQQENNKNITMSARNKSGIMGVSRCTSGNKWVVRIGCNGKHKSFGRYEDLELAELIAKEVYATLGYHNNHGSKKGALL